MPWAWVWGSRVGGGAAEGPEQRPRASVTHRACGHKQGGCCHVAHQALKFSCLLPGGPFQAPMTGPPQGAPSQQAHEQAQRVTADPGTSQEKGELVLASRSHDDNGANPLSLRSAPHHSGPFPASPTIAPDTPATHFHCPPCTRPFPASEPLHRLIPLLGESKKASWRRGCLCWTLKE